VPRAPSRGVLSRSEFPDHHAAARQCSRGDHIRCPRASCGPVAGQCGPVSGGFQRS
jgi:hypothetical protein